MTTSLMLLVLSLVAGVVAAWEKLTAPEYRKRILGWLTIFFLLCSLGLQGYRENSTRTELEGVQTFIDLEERRIDEASGAASLNGRIFVVDDEDPKVYQYSDTKGETRDKATFFEEYRIRSSQEMQSAIKPKIIDQVDDLEAAATYKNKLYLVTSHSLNKKRERKDSRELILEIERFESAGLSGEAVAYVGRAATLVPSLEHALQEVQSQRQGSLIENEDRLNIEGLAIDANGNAYIGLRNPLLKIGNQEYAIVLRMTIESIFSESPKAKVFALRLEDSGKDYGITSLEYDQKTQAVLVLGNSPQKEGKEGFFPPKLWIWHPNDHHTQTPNSVRNWSLKIPEKFHAKPEALVLGVEQGFIFIDARGHGGRRVFDRGDLGL